MITRRIGAALTATAVFCLMLTAHPQAGESNPAEFDVVEVSERLKKQFEDEERLNELFRAWEKEAKAKRYCIIHIGEEVSRKYTSSWQVYVLGIARGSGRENASLAEINDLWFETMIRSYTPRFGAEMARKIMEELRAKHDCH